MINLLVKLFVKNSEKVGEPKVRQSYGMLAGSVGIACNLLLFLIKIFAGFATGAVSIMADAFNNLSDAGSSVVTLIGFHMAGKPADPEHPFGHGRIEYLSGLFVAVAILLMGFELLKSSVGKILHPEEIEFKTVSVVILAVAILLKFWMAHFNFTLGKRIDSEAMKATGTDSLSDCISTGAVLFGIVLYYFFHINLDGWIGALVAVLVSIAGITAIRDTIQPLLGASPDPEMVNGIYEMVMKESIVIGVHDMIIHDYGPGRRLVSLHAEVPYDIDILAAHDVIDNIEQMIASHFQCEVTIHMDPVVTDDEELKEARGMVETLIGQESSQWKLHDFRMVRGATHTNVIFDLVVPGEDITRRKEIEKEIREKVHEYNAHYFAVVKVEQSYV